MIEVRLMNLKKNKIKPHIFPSQVLTSNPHCIHCVPPELLSQLSGVRRSAGGQLSSGPSASQLQQLQMQLQLERQQAQAARQQLETARNATRGGRANAILNTNSAAMNPNPSANHNTNPSPNPGPPEQNTHHTAHSSQFLLSRLDLCSIYWISFKSFKGFFLLNIFRNMHINFCAIN